MRDLQLARRELVGDPRRYPEWAGDIVKVKVLEVDPVRKRISLTMKLGAPVARPGGPRENDPAFDDVVQGEAGLADLKARLLSADGAAWVARHRNGLTSEAIAACMKRARSASPPKRAPKRSANHEGTSSGAIPSCWASAGPPPGTGTTVRAGSASTSTPDSNAARSAETAPA